MFRDISLEITMPSLPSGRRIEFSLDRFHALLGGLDRRQASAIAMHLGDPDDLLFVLDAVHFSLKEGAPYFAGYVAADWSTYAADWSTADRQALQVWLISPEARDARAEAIDYIKSLLLDGPDSPVAYPYLIQGEFGRVDVSESSPLRQ
jgi:hypothetical protein